MRKPPNCIEATLPSCAPDKSINVYDEYSVYLLRIKKSRQSIAYAYLPANTKDPNRPRSDTGTHEASSLLIAGYTGP